MTATASPRTTTTDLVALAHELGPKFAERAERNDTDDSFVHENYAELKAARVFAAGVPAELGGGGASYAEIAEMLRTLAHYDGSTALAVSMHSHLIAATVWKWQRDKSVEGLLKRVAAENLVLVSSGGSDWLASSGVAEPVEGGYRVTARKIFASGSPAGQLLMTSAIYDDPQAGPQVLHFPVSLAAKEVRSLDTWHTLGMRGSGSNDLLLDGVFVPDATIGLRRNAGVWHPFFHVVTLMALPLVYAVYVGLAEEARTLALALAARRKDESDLVSLVGELDTELASARLALQDMVRAAMEVAPSPETSNRVAIGRTLAGRAVLRTVDKAMEVAGGSAFYRRNKLERIFRDIQGARYHPMQEKIQLRYTGRIALGLDING